MSSLRQISRTWSKVVEAAPQGWYVLGFESSNVYSISQLSGAALPSTDRADGRQSRQPITCVSAVAGGGITSKKWTKVTDY